MDITYSRTGHDMSDYATSYYDSTNITRRHYAVTEIIENRTYLVALAWTRKGAKRAARRAAVRRPAVYKFAY